MGFLKVQYFKMYSLFLIKAEFSAPLLQSSVSRDLSEIILIRWFATAYF